MYLYAVYVCMYRMTNDMFKVRMFLLFNTRTTKGGQNDLFDMVEVGIPQSLVVLVLRKP